jgi:hypothetical protein
MLDRTDDGRKIKIELVKTRFFTRYPCDVCGGCTEKVSVLARGHDLLVCETCLEAGDIDERLKRHAAALMAAVTRGLIGRLQVPSWAEWQAAEKAVIEDEARYDRANDIAHNAEQMAIKYDNIAFDPKVIYRVIFHDGEGNSMAFQAQLGAERLIAEYGEGEIKREEREENIDFPF